MGDLYPAVLALSIGNQREKRQMKRWQIKAFKGKKTKGKDKKKMENSASEQITNGR